jgi:hypothetical protein
MTMGLSGLGGSSGGSSHASENPHDKIVSFRFWYSYESLFGYYRLHWLCHKPGNCSTRRTGALGVEIRLRKLMVRVLFTI